MKKIRLATVLIVGMMASGGHALIIGDPDVTMTGTLNVNGDVIVGLFGQAFIQVRPGIADAWTLRVFHSGGNRDVLSLVKGSAGTGDYIEAVQGNTNTVVFKVSDGGDVWSSGMVTCEVLEIAGEGALDLAEAFQVAASPTSIEVMPGMVLSIDPNNAGMLVPSAQAYDRKVAGIVSGAGDLKPGMLLGGNVAKADRHPVALSGRVYCYVDATSAPVEPGDLLTTSDVPGYAMKVTDYTRAQGAVLGKAMTGLSSGKGLVLVLVSLQ